jgi:hypothetical protein
MPRINTGRNYVQVGKALPGDRYVATYMMPQHGPMCLLCTEPMDQLESAIRRAMDMAECMAGPLMVTPVPSEDELLRQIITAVGFEGLHRKDPADQRAGRDLLIKLGVLKE